MHAVAGSRHVEKVVMVVAVDVFRQRPVPPAVCIAPSEPRSAGVPRILSLARRETKTAARTSVPRHNTRGDDDVPVPGQVAVRIERRLDRPR